jgi:hypothetical protein
MNTDPALALFPFRVRVGNNTNTIRGFHDSEEAFAHADRMADANPDKTISVLNLEWEVIDSIQPIQNCKGLESAGVGVGEDYGDELDDDLRDLINAAIS